jgi:hypothetical protein
MPIRCGKLTVALPASSRKFSSVLPPNIPSIVTLWRWNL